MHTPAWLTTTSSQLMVAGAAAVIAATAVIGASNLDLLGSSSSAGGAPSYGGGAVTAAKPQPSATATPCNNGNGGGNGNCSSGSDNKTFAISGIVQQLVPGAQRSISLSLTNNASQAINVKTLTVQAADVKNTLGVVVCAASNLLLGSPATAGSGSFSPASLTIAGNATATGVAFPVKLAASAGNGCKSVTWQLTYSGTADQA
jgi:hypothetical protein